MNTSKTFAALVSLFCLNLFFSQLSSADDAINGEKIFKAYCAHCHNSSDKESRVGAPGLKDVLSRHDEAWINQWIKSPETLVKTDHKALQISKSNRFGLTMPTLPAMQEEQNRRDVIAYLKTLE